MSVTRRVRNRLACWLPIVVVPLLTGDVHAQDDSEDTPGMICQKAQDRADATVQRAALAPEDAFATWESATRQYWDIWEKFRPAPDHPEESPCDHIEEVLRMAAIAATHAHLMATAIRAWRTLYESMEGTHAAIDAPYEAGKLLERIAVFDGAAEAYAIFAMRHPQRPEAEPVLRKAVGFDIADQSASIVEHLDLYLRNYASRFPANAASLVLDVASGAVEREAWQDAFALLTHHMDVLDGPNAPLDARIRTHVFLAHLLLRESQSPQSEYARAVAPWDEHPADAATMRALAAADDGIDWRSRLERTLDALAEAYFYAAKVKSTSVVKTLQTPNYLAAVTEESIAAYARTTLAPWVQRTSDAIVQVAREFDKIPALGSPLPARWSVRAAEESGLLWKLLDEGLRSIRVPEIVAKTRLLSGAWAQRRTELESSVVTRATAAMRRCVTLARSEHVQDQFEEPCLEWLFEQGGADSVDLVELRQLPTDEPATPLARPTPADTDWAHSSAGILP